MKLNNHILAKINDYYISSKVKFYAHARTAEIYNLLNIYLTLPVLIISTVNTLLASYNSNSTVIDPTVALIVAILSAATTIGHAVLSYFDYGTKYQTHMSSSNNYQSLTRLMETEIYTNIYNDIDGTEIEQQNYTKYLFDKIATELDNIQSSEPYIPTIISGKNYSMVVHGRGLLTDVLIDMPSSTMDEPLVNMDSPSLVANRI
jgi:ABC-type multidrug transport system fused ATPase/permease subunit